MSARAEVMGLKFNRLTVVSEAEPVIETDGNSHRRVNCLCECGSMWMGRLAAIKNGSIKSCGCLRADNNVARSTHGAAKRGSPTRTYRAWTGMKARCFNPKETFYRHYGGRGITICDRWNDSFQNFLDDMGEAPPGMSIDRIEVNGNYEPGNCRWATQKEQASNKRNNRILSMCGSSKTMTEWAEALRLPVHVIYGRLRLGWSDEDALLTPVRPQAKRQAKQAKEPLVLDEV